MKGENQAMEKRPKTVWIFFQRDFFTQRASSFFNCSIPCKIAPGNDQFFGRGPLGIPWEYFSYRFVIPNGIELRAQHDHGEDSKEERLEGEEEKENHSGGWGVSGAIAPLRPDAVGKLIDSQEDRMSRYYSNIELQC